MTTQTRTALDLRGDRKRTRESLLASIDAYDQATDVLLEEARAEGYRQALVDCNAALMQGMPSLHLLLSLKLPPRPEGQEIERNDYA